jgi:hypothetical protein
MVKHMNSRTVGRLIGCVVLGVIVFTSAQLAQPAPAVHAAADLLVYDDQLVGGWQDDYSWNSTVNLSNASPARGTASIAVTYNAPWAALSLRTSPALDNHNYNAITFWVNGGASSPSLSFSVQITDSRAIC